jgi:diguanylate cyclase (GGDEF)-like protein
MLLATAILLGGLALSAVGGLAWRAIQNRDERQSFRATSANVIATLDTQLRRNADFVASVRGLLTMVPDVSPTAFTAWYSALDGKRRTVGSVGTAVVRRVPGAELGSFIARRDRDPAFLRLVGSLWTVEPDHRSDYCLIAAGSQLALDPTTLLMLQDDWCHSGTAVALTEAPLLQSATDSGQMVVMSMTALSTPTMFLEAPVYTRGMPVDTVAQRRRAALGWAITTFDLPRLLSGVIGDNEQLSVALSHRNPGQPSQLVGRAGHSPSTGATSVTRSLSIDGPWTVTVRGAAATGGLSPDQQAGLLFAVGSLSAVLMFLLLIVLARGRARALGMVEQKTVELRYRALHDSLTGLPNRALALDRAEQLLARARRSQLPLAALYIDVDGFKYINDTFGHPAGDAFLRMVAGRLTRVIRESDTAARLAGDEFVVLIEGSGLDAGPELVAERVLEVLSEPYDMNAEIGRQLSVTASIGVAHGLRGSAEELLADADVALYAAKASGKARYVVFESGMESAAQERLMLKMDLDEALAAEQLYLVYQPTFDLHSERATGVEALIRWRHPERGLIGPDVFIPIAEESGSIVSIGRWVLAEACRQAATWRRQGHDIELSVNVSGRQLADDGLIGDVREALEVSGLDPSALTLEITETILMHDTAATAAQLAGVKGLGVHVAIDDFGTGYSSLSYLCQFSVDSLKIDRSFINNLAVSTEAAALIQTVVQLGKTLGLRTFAEGIEDLDQLRELQRQQCDRGQGFLFARPLEVDAADEFLKAHAAGPIAPRDDLIYGPSE